MHIKINPQSGFLAKHVKGMDADGRMYTPQDLVKLDPAKQKDALQAAATNKGDDLFIKVGDDVYVATGDALSFKGKAKPGDDVLILPHLIKGKVLALDDETPDVGVRTRVAGGVFGGVIGGLVGMVGAASGSALPPMAGVLVGSSLGHAIGKAKDESLVERPDTQKMKQFQSAPEVEE